MRQLMVSMRRTLAIVLLAFTACSESHAGRATHRDADADATMQTGEDDEADAAEWLDAAAAATDGRARLDAARADASNHEQPPEGESTGVVGGIALAGDTLRAVRSDNAKISVEVRATAACGPPPADVTVSVVVSVTHSDCETLGPLEVDRTDPNAVTFTAWLWRSDAPCRAQLLSSRVLKLGRAWSPGRYTFAQSAPGESQTLTITASEATCDEPEGRPCTHYCDCDSGQTCQYRADANRDCKQSCETECDNELGCQRPWASTTCRADTHCATGQRCMDGRCRWSISVGQDTRHACMRHADCDAGLLCVEGTDGKLGCEVVCNTENMLCPGWHYCTRDATYSRANWVCEWGGE